MSDTLTPPPAVGPSSAAAGEPSDGGGSFFQNLADMYFAPRQAFARIVRKPAFILPLVGQLLLAFAFSGIWLNKMEPREFMKTQLEEQGRWEKLNPEQREAVLNSAPIQMKIFGWVGPAIGTPVVWLLTATVLMFIYRFFFASEVGFKQSLAIVAWCSFAVGLVTTPLMLLVFQLKGDWNLNPQDVLQANLGLLVDKASVAKPLWALLTSIDLFSFWTMFLLAAGFAVASRKTTGSALWGVAIPWAVLILIKVGWAAVMG